MSVTTALPTDGDSIPVETTEADGITAYPPEARAVTEAIVTRVRDGYYALDLCDGRGRVITSRELSGGRLRTNLRENAGAFAIQV